LAYVLLADAEPGVEFERPCVDFGGYGEAFAFEGLGYVVVEVEDVGDKGDGEAQGEQHQGAQAGAREATRGAFGAFFSWFGFGGASGSGQNGVRGCVLVSCVLTLACMVMEFVGLDHEGGFKFLGSCMLGRFERRRPLSHTRREPRKRAQPKIADFCRCAERSSASLFPASPLGPAIAPCIALISGVLPRLTAASLRQTV